MAIWASTSKTGLAEQQEQLRASEQGINLLLNDDLLEAQRVLEAQKDSPYALVGLGVCAFLTAAIGLEDDRLNHSMETLSAAEKAAKKQKATAVPDDGQWWTTQGLEYEVLLGDVVAAQSLVHILGESYAEYMKALWKLNSAWKYFAAIYKAVFPKDISPTSTVASITAELSERYEGAVLASALKNASLSGASHSKTLAAVGKLKGLAPRSAGSSTTDLNKAKAVLSGSSLPSSARASMDISPPGTSHVKEDMHGDAIPEALWTKSPITSFIISGAAFGHAIFELVFALMPPKGRKIFSWLGYGTGDRKKALKLLEVVATTGTDIHASFASLALVLYYSGILMSSGWQCDRQRLMTACSNVVSRSLDKQGQGSLWLVNQAKLSRLNGDVDTAVQQLRSALTKPNVYRQAKSTLQFELCWVLLSKGDYVNASSGFAEMVKLNSWSHPTYWALAASCLQELPSRTAEQEQSMREMYMKITTSFLRKRFMGQPPSSEIYLEKRMKFYRAKSDKWIAQGRLKEGAEWFESTQISIALELSLYWNQFAHYPKDGLKRLTSRLTGYLEAKPTDLDTPEEVALCHTILGACFLTSKDYPAAREHLGQAESQSATLGEAYNYLAALSRLYQAILECQEADSDFAKKENKAWWKEKLGNAEKKLDEMFALPAYDMNGRVESRGQMLRVEIGEKRQRLALV